MSSIASEKYNAEKELGLIKMSIPNPLMAEAYKQLLRDLERHDLGICDDRRTALRVKGADVKVKLFIASNCVQNKNNKVKKFYKLQESERP